jgi:hypothetical protein
LIPILAVLCTIFSVLVLAVVLVIFRNIAINGRSRPFFLYVVLDHFRLGILGSFSGPSQRRRLGMDRNIKAELVVGGVVVADCCSILRSASQPDPGKK